MSSWQQIIVVGNVGKDAEMKYLQSGQAVCSFTLAVNEKWKNSAGERQEKTTWFRVTAWGQLGENVHQYLTKGKLVLVTGTVEARAYTDNAGKPAASLELRAREIRLLGGKADGAAEVASGGEVAAEDVPF